MISSMAGQNGAPRQDGVANVQPGAGGEPRPRLAVQQDELARFCRTNLIQKLSLFGSVLKGTARPDSDVDLLIEFAPEARPSLLDLARMEFELSALLGGRRVDLRTAGELSRHFRDEVVREAEVQYVAA
jgi:uncharacterized protein